MTDNDAATRTKDTLQSLWKDIFCTGFSCEAPHSSLVAKFSHYLPSQEQISAFLSDGKLYDHDKKQWVTIPEGMRHSNLVLELQRIMKEVKGHFKYSARGVHVLHQDNILVSIRRQDKTSDNIWKHTSSVIMVRTCDEVEDLEGSLKIELEAAFYAQQCFHTEGNRIFCLVLVTEEWAKLFYYDRGGCLETPSISIHDSPEEFIWYLLLISCPNDESLGLDKTIRWNAETQVHTITTVDEEDNEIDYRLVNPQPLFRSSKIKGRATTCWEVEGKNGERLIIKDAWRDEISDSPPEWEMLERTRGMQGVVQMVAYESGCSLECLRHPFHQPMFMNRFRTRIILKAYGDPIDYCEHREQLLYAFRDAVVGHRNLWDRGILHRDISLNNILLGKSGAPIGERGIVIDLDLAVYLEPEQPLPKASDAVGTLGFMSTHLLSFSPMKMRFLGPPKRPLCNFQTHLDDLWSFFYCLCWTCFGADGTKKEYYEMLDEWEDTELTSFRSKCEFLSGLQRGDYKAPVFFGSVFDDLILDLSRYLTDIEDKFQVTLLALVDDNGSVHKRDVDDDARKHYDGYLKIVDKAIEALKNEVHREVARIVDPVDIFVEETISLVPEESVLGPLGDITLNALHVKRKRDVQYGPEEDRGEKSNGEQTARKIKKVKEVENSTHEDRTI